ncbi:response regulator transcription factor [Paenibacillus sacheonensis]|uniref:Response regulator n=1 Tax=Paenibacillus sacheonensis TaxID=742054 RepID=A0A7X5C0X6_9BACL|nr:response regulator transcription factor [Paenibacillus sacheonensis]MBM7565842.1 DNA-binding response OmpR family regulator [Paenibacillus sacheonensis]NBC68839.1 response regulator [Paenibacillus sacheonensis]
MSIKILIADDESNIRDVCTRYLEREGYEVITAGDGEEALRLWAQASPDLLILDVMMPKTNGFQVCEEIRNMHDTPIILLTARGEENDRIVGLTMGADDYITKPFSPRELVLRVKSILRRLRSVQSPKQESLARMEKETISFPGLVIHLPSRKVEVNGVRIDLTVKEFELLTLLATHPEQAFSRSQLLNKVWDVDYYGDMTTVTVHIRRLREKIEASPSEPNYIKTVWGIGYKFEGREAR